MYTIRPATSDDLEAIALLTTELATEFIAPDCTTEGAVELLSNFALESVRERFAGGSATSLLKAIQPWSA